MQSKKMWQTFAATIVFLFLSSLVAWGVSRFSCSWKIFFGIGFGIMLIAIVPLFFHQRQPKAPLLTLFLNIFSCGFLIGSYFLGSHLRLSLPTAVFPITPRAACSRAAAGSRLDPIPKTSYVEAYHHASPGRPVWPDQGDVSSVTGTR